MSKTDIATIVSQINEWQEIMDEARQMVESLKDTIKSEMDRSGVDTLDAGTCIIRWTEVLSQRFDSTAFKKVMPDVYKAYTKQIVSRRFTIC